jgi:hypothetical protein
MDWMQDMAARWVRILTAGRGDRTPLDEAVDQIAAISGSAAVKKSRFKRDAVAPPGVPPVTVLSRQLIAGVVISDLMLDRLCALAGQTRQQVLEQLSADLPGHLPGQELRALRAELSGDLPTERASYAGLGSRIEQVIRLAEGQAVELINEARAEAARIAAPGGPSQPCPRCGYGGQAGGHQAAPRQASAELPRKYSVSDYPAGR